MRRRADSRELSRVSSSARKKELTSEPTGREPAVRESSRAAASTWRRAEDGGEPGGVLGGEEGERRG